MFHLRVFWRLNSVYDAGKGNLRKTTSHKVCFPFVGDHVGGSHVSSLLLIQNLQKHGFESLICLCKKGLLSDYLSQQGLSFHIFEPPVEFSTGSILFETRQMISNSVRLASWLRKNKIDIVHTSDLRMNTLWGLPARLSGAKFIWHQRSINDSRRLAIYAMLANKVLTISKFCKQSFTSSLAAKAEIVYNPFREIKLNRLSQKKFLRRQLGLDDSVRVIGFVGNLTRQKKPELFVDMAIKLGNIPDLHFVMIGEKRAPIYGELIDRISSKGFTERLSFVGTQVPIEPWLAGLDVLVAPGVNEGFGRVLVESMLLRVPVIASHSGGHCEIIVAHRNGVLVDLNDSTALANACLDILEKPDIRAKFVENAYNDVIQKFSVKEHVDQLVRIYYSLI